MARAPSPFSHSGTLAEGFKTLLAGFFWTGAAAPGIIHQYTD
jgi:hypothetical protein